MNKLLRTELFNLLIEKSKEEVNNNVMQNAYDEFIEKIRDISNENDYSTIYRILVATRIEIASRNITTLRAGGKMRLKSCSYKRHWVLLEKVPIFATERVI